MRTLIFSTQFLLIILLNGCERKYKESENCHHSIVFSNNSDKIVYAEYDNKGYPDSTYLFNGASPLNYRWLIINAYEQNNKRALQRYPYDGYCYESVFSTYKKPVMIFVYDSQALETTSFIRPYYDRIVLQRYDITLEDLRKLDWKITYPPDERMKYVKMHPPYKEVE